MLRVTVMDKAIAMRLRDARRPKVVNPQSDRPPYATATLRKAVCILVPDPEGKCGDKWRYRWVSG